METEKPLKEQIPCECGCNCDMGVIISGLGDKIKIQIINESNIMSVIVNKEKLLEKIK